MRLRGFNSHNGRELHIRNKTTGTIIGSGMCTEAIYQAVAEQSAVRLRGLLSNNTRGTAQQTHQQHTHRKCTADAVRKPH
jgi:hypothetical protein